ncbi:MAG: CheR family methyltransferase, partial [Desulfobacterales bacterium]|nr:CheR family methyltransferase [Desulfobacterales bacterium]
DHIYVIPPNKNLSILNGSLFLMDLSKPRGFNLPIDNFFRSLAQDQGSNATCMILSGTGTDGTLGVKAIKDNLGMVMVQSEDSAKYDGMPRSAISTGLVDYVLPIEDMPDQLIKYTQHAIIKKEIKIETSEDQFQKSLNKIFILLRSQTNHDFSHYKKNTICRRIERRMHVHQIDSVKDYVNFLNKSEREIQVLFKDLLIRVTSFFRDPEAFDNLKNNLLSCVLKGKPYGYRVRVWVAGCSSGEEAYSIAILIQECMEQLGQHFDVQIFGTDIDEDAVNLARSGFYPLSISADISTERLKKYFIKEDNHFKVKKSIREMLIFASQNLIKDPPFTKLDILSCRNLLIYFGPKLQKQVWPIFHYSLKEEGLLFLGSSESIGQASEFFEIQDKKWNIFKRQATTNGAHFVPVFSVPPLLEKLEGQTSKKAESRSNDINSLKLVETILEQSDTPPCAIIDEKNNIIYIHGRTGRYLEPAIGKVSVNIIEMARPGLKVALAAILRKAITSKQQIIQNGIEIGENGNFIIVDLIVKPLQEWGAMSGLVMVAFKESLKTTGKGKLGQQPKNKDRINVEQELQYTKENLQTTIEELETSNEELKSTNEELQSTNEELQSTNEELETSKEELQSLNEESATVTAELQSRIEELSKTTDDMKNFLDSTQVATIFLDIDLNIMRFTLLATQLIPLSEIDIGRPISHFATQIQDIQIADLAQKVLDNLVIIEKEVQSTDNKIYTLRIVPYRTIQNVIDGVVIIFLDITEFKIKEIQLRRLATIVTDSNDAITLQDALGNITAWNYGAEQLYGYSQKEAIKMNIEQVVPKEGKKNAKAFIKKILEGEDIKSFKTQRLTKKGNILDVWLTVTLLKDEQGNPEGIATTERDLGKLSEF